MSIDWVAGAFQRKMALMNPAMPAQLVLVGEATTNEQYVLSPHTMASHALRTTGPPAVLAKPHGNFPSATDILALALCWPSNLAKAVEPRPVTMH